MARLGKSIPSTREELSSYVIYDIRGSHDIQDRSAYGGE